MYTYTYSFFILCIAFHVARMKTKFCRSSLHHTERFSSPALSPNSQEDDIYDDRSHNVGIPQGLCRRVTGIARFIPRSLQLQAQITLASQ